MTVKIDVICSSHEQPCFFLSFEKSRTIAENKVLVDLLNEVEKDSTHTQRSLSKRLGVALGLTNQYLRTCVQKGWLRASQLESRRILYFITPAGFQEKSRMVSNYLLNSLHFFKDARQSCERAGAKLKHDNVHSIVLVGEGELSNIATLVLRSMDIDVLPYNASIHHNNAWYLLADITAPQQTYDALVLTLEPKRIVCLDLLHVRDAGLEANT